VQRSSHLCSHISWKRKLNDEPIEDSKDEKYGTFKLLFSKEVSFEGEILKEISQLKFIDNYFNDRMKYPQFAPSWYLQQVHYLDNRVTRIEPQWWENGLAQSGLLKILNVQNFNRSSSRTTCVRQLFMLVHDRQLWMEDKISIDQMLIWRIMRLPYQGRNPAEEFIRKDQDCALEESMKQKYGLMKGNRGYNINFISDQVVCLVAHIMAGNIISVMQMNSLRRWWI